MNSERKIVVVRHAHRDTSDRSQDNGISLKGQEQVKQLGLSYKNGDLPMGDHFWSSPKARCQQTLESLSRLAKKDLKTEKLLDEQLSDETSKEFRARIAALTDKILNTKGSIYVCSHGDLIPELIESFTGYWVDLRKGQAAVLVQKDGRWALQ